MRIFDNPNLNFIKWRWHALALSALVIGAGLFTIVSRGGLPLGVDFSGGTVMVLKFVQPTNEEAVRQALPSLGDVVVQTVGAAADNEILIRLPMMQEAEEGANLEAKAIEVENALRAAKVGDFQIVSKDIVGPIMGKDLQNKGIWATLASLGGILAYIWFRFRLDVRGGRHRGDAPRRAGDARVPDVVRLRPVAERRRGAPDHHRLLGQRHDRGLRPRA